MSNITEYLQSFTTRRSVQNAEASGRATFSNVDEIYKHDWSGNLALDKKVELAAGYTGVDPAKAVCLTGLIAGANPVQAVEDAKKQVSITVMSPF